MCYQSLQCIKGRREKKIVRVKGGKNLYFMISFFFVFVFFLFYLVLFLFFVFFIIFCSCFCFCFFFFNMKVFVLLWGGGD